MSGTRSLSRTAPAIDRRLRPGSEAELVIVAHGERGGAGDNRGLIELAAAVGRRCRYAKVSAAVLKGEPSLERALPAIGRRCLHIYPLFMSDGYYVRTAIRKRVESALGPFATSLPPIRMHRPFGLEPGLAGMIARHAAARSNNLPTRMLVLVGHGSSKSDDSRIATEWQAVRIRALGAASEVRTAYLENAPFLPDVLAGLPAGPAVVVGLFSGAGQHGAEDVPAAIAATGRTDLTYTGPVGAIPAAASLIAASLSQSARQAAES